MIDLSVACALFFQRQPASPGSFHFSQEAF
jgi:hypothetical protein